VKLHAEELPASVAGIDWRNLRKGDVIPAHKVIEMYHVLFSRNTVLTAAEQSHQNYQTVKVKTWLENARNTINQPIVFKQEHASIVALTDAEAIPYLNGQAYQGLNKHRRSTRRMFTQIDTENLAQHDRDQLQVNQSRHALIASAADGARRQAVKILKQGGQLPTLMPPDL
jgi:hypothetical protein